MGGSGGTPCDTSRSERPFLKAPALPSRGRPGAPCLCEAAKEGNTGRTGQGGVVERSRTGCSAHLHLSSAAATGLRAELLPPGSHGPGLPAPPARPEPPGDDSPRDGTKAPPQPDTGAERTSRDPASTYRAPASRYLRAPGTLRESPVDIPAPRVHSSPCGHPRAWQASPRPSRHPGTLLASLAPAVPPCNLWVSPALCGHPSTLWAHQHLPFNPVQKCPVREPWRKDRACFSPVSLQGDKGYPGYPSTCLESWHPLGILVPSGHADTPSGQQYLSRETLVI